MYVQFRVKHNLNVSTLHLLIHIKTSLRKSVECGKILFLLLPVELYFSTFYNFMMKIQNSRMLCLQYSIK